MINTFISLAEKSPDKLTPEERQLMLSALFRPATSGLVKDEGSPFWALEMVKSIGKKGAAG